MDTRHPTPQYDTHARYLAKVNALISEDREDLVGEIVAEYAQLTEDEPSQNGPAAA
jgi:hypothetical protein